MSMLIKHSRYDTQIKCYAVQYFNTSVPVPSKMMASKKKHLIFYCHFIYFAFNLFSEKKNPENKASQFLQFVNWIQHYP